MEREGVVEMISTVQEHSFPEGWYEVATESHFWFEWRLNVMLRQIKARGVSLQDPLKVLEVGCGTGALRRQVESVTNWTIDGTDLDIKALSRVRPGRGKILYYDIHDEQEPFVGAYDAVILFDVLEHIDDTGPFVRSLLRHIKPQGFLLVNVPALQTLYSDYDRLVGHARRYNTKTLSEEFNGSGLTIEDMRYWGLSMVPLLILRRLLFRIFSNRTADQRIGCGMNPPNALIDRAFRTLLRTETAVLSRPPLGSSLLLFGRKA